MRSTSWASRGRRDSLTSYQCVGEHAGGLYAFDQNNLDWTGNVLLFTQSQLTAYKTAHPNQNMRILAIEDDDGACQIRLDGDRFKTFQTTLQTAYPNLTGGKDSTSGARPRSSSGPMLCSGSSGRRTRGSPPRMT